MRDVKAILEVETKFGSYSTPITVQVDDFTKKINLDGIVIEADKLIPDIAFLETITVTNMQVYVPYQIANTSLPQALYHKGTLTLQQCEA